MRYIPSSNMGRVSAAAPTACFRPNSISRFGRHTSCTANWASHVVHFRQPETDDAGRGHVAAGDVWGIHDFTRHRGASASTWLEMIEKNYGGATNAADWVELSQFIDYDGYRAMFEAQGKKPHGPAVVD